MRNLFRMCLCVVLVGSCAAARGVQAQESTASWTHVGLLRVRDVFGR